MTNKYPHLALIVAFFMLCMSAQAVTREEVVAGAELLYRARIVEAQSKFQLDNDPAFLARVQRIALGLIEQAKREHPVTAALDWEIHTSDDPEESAFCMAGGKMLVSHNYVNTMDLNNAELAMLLSHEIQHAVLEHNLKEFQEALRIEPNLQKYSFLALEDAVDHDETLMAKLSKFNVEQENQADLEGLQMAWRAGWPALKLAGFFQKLARIDPMAHFDSLEHPAPARRWQAARKLAEELDQIKAPAVPMR
ncbi:M48 family metalloprotease [Solimicrobium silvestre]|uniref:Peptidase family M48 n=1 Tax=Solimicrobium silvestre TaxID=2099400 RepID=A0A2S9GZJ2_9BURK|nr:M48 family metalloprotease [Solimicrobium silvestre]PRC93036.1 Peptidase family M48 [Solimicrobium silvestre]